MNEWQLQKAKAQLSEVVKRAVTNGPQSITVHGEPTVMVISKKDYDRLTKPGISFIEFMRKSPLVGLNLNIKRDKSSTRDVDL
jgi:antitoxin Phd